MARRNAGAGLRRLRGHRGRLSTESALVAIVNRMLPPLTGIISSVRSQEPPVLQRSAGGGACGGRANNTIIVDCLSAVPFALSRVLLRSVAALLMRSVACRTHGSRKHHFFQSASQWRANASSPRLNSACGSHASNRSDAILALRPRCRRMRLGVDGYYQAIPLETWSPRDGELHQQFLALIMSTAGAILAQVSVA